MPGKVGVKIKAGRNLPVMDRSSDTTDAYVEIKLGNVTHKTDVCRKSLNPQWNTDWFRFEVDDAELQDEPLQIRLMDYDTYSANDAIGKVNISLNSLCLEMSGPTTHGKGTVLSGWIPVFDTMHGIRGEVNVIVKVDLFSDLNKFRQSSCGIPFFHSQCIPYGYRAQMIHGFVEELVVNDDPEYQWIDKIRTPRASNEARQVVFLKLSGQVQRKMGLKAINMGANAVIGYTQCFDLEGDVGVVARGIGTAVTLIKDTSSSQPAAGTADNALIEERTMKYIEFLTGSHINLAEQPPPCELQIRKSRSSTLFDLQHANTGAMEDNEIMHDLMRQEDERGEKPAKKLRHHMKRFTHSSRNILNEKYNAFMRKFGESVESKSPSSTSRSLSSLCASGGLIKDDAIASGSSSRSSTGTAYDLRRRPSFKAKHKMFGVAVGGVTAKPAFLQRQSTVKRSSGSGSTGGSAAANPHAILRSVSAEYNAANKTGSPAIASISEYSDSTRSSPNICSDGHDDNDYDEEQLAAMLELQRAHGKQTQLNYCHKNYDYKTPSLASGSCDRSDSSSCVDVLAAIGGYHPFGEFSQHEPHQLQLDVHDTVTIRSGSPNTFSLSNSDSSGSEAELARELARGEAEERIKMQKYLKICKDTERVDAKWIQPSDLEGFDDSLTDLTPRRSLLRDLKTLSQHVQDFIHSKPKKVEKSPTPSPQQQRRAAAPSQEKNTLLLQPPSEASKAYYSSQPEICLNWEGDMCAPPPTTHISHSRSLINLRRSDANSPTTTYNNANAPELDLTTTKDDMYATNAYGYGYVSDSDSSSAYLPVTVKTFASNAKCPVFKICPSTPSPSETDLKIPFIEDDASTVVDDSASESTEIPTPILGNSTLSIATVSAAAPLDVMDVIANSPVNSRKSLNEVNAAAVASSNAFVAAAAAASSGITDSPSLKRFASPAQAAIVAAAAAMPSANTIASAPSSASLVPGPSSNGGRAKLTASPSKLALNSVGATGASNTTTTAGTALNTSISSTASTTDGGATNSIPAPSKDTMPTEMCRRSSDSDLSITPKGNSLCVASERLVAATALMRLNQPLGAKNTNTDGMDGLLEYPFLTMTKYPPGFILHLGATVAARSVKLLERVPNPDEPEVRDSWWTELRMEIRSHARALGCNVVLGYSEATTISDDVCVLSATGTAAVINMAYNRSVSQTDILNAAVKPVGIGFGIGSTGGTMSASLEERETLKDMRNGIANETILSHTKDTTISSSLGTTIYSSVGKKNGIPASMGVVKSSACSVCHVPYNLASVPFNVKMKKCAICRKGRVPDVLLATLEVPERLHVTGRGCFMQAQVVRAKKDLRSELNAKEISDGLPFLEYELHRVLINKLKAKGMNAIFGLRAQVAIGERMIALIATGTALFLSALPVPQVPKIVAGNSWTDKQKLNELQKKLQETFERNQEVYQLKCIDPDVIGGGVATLDKQSDTDESDDEVIEIDLNCGNKDTCVLEVDDIEDLEIISLLMETYPPEGFHVVNTQSVPGILEMEAVKNLQMFTQVWRAKLDVNQNINGFPKHFQRILQTIYFKLRTMIPCAICDLRFRLDLPESDQIQLLVTGMALGLDDANKFKYRRKAAVTSFTNGTVTDAPDANGLSAGNKRTLQEEDYIFPLDEDQMVETPTPTSNLPPYGLNSFKLAKTSPSRQHSKKGTLINRNNYFPLRDRYGVDITPLSFVPGGRIDKYLGNLNFFFIRETTSIRENGGISGFVHSFITEGQCLISIGGDAVYVSYHTDD
ncbi:C2 domain-containing protein 5 isoform X3 [Bactrocera oleae]|uniref:C2 domain-containing protein 5 isoform X3 n=1 Tax=Bactrocera oleae TaxID=104688 RepID=UPI00387E3C3D